MPNSKSAEKRLRQGEKRRERNKSYTSQIHSQVKKFEAAVAAQDAEAAKKEFLKAATILDIVAGKGMIHRNTASRKKSRMHAQLLHLAPQAPAGSADAKTEEGGQ
ncbi:MAG: 30S ribosomal protein S20 [Planctomycetes bacterium]|nr:30S ribosomal protein S20 [Planctomycetota bacterium]